MMKPNIPYRATKMVVEWAKIYQSGSGIIWNDEIDISEYEILINGIEL